MLFGVVMALLPWARPHARRVLLAILRFRTRMEDGLMASPDDPPDALARLGT